MTKFETRNALVRFFSARSLKKLLSYFESDPQIYLIAKFRKKKFLNLVPKMPYLDVFWEEFQNNIAIFDINIVTKVPEFDTKIA